jgi:hypothetical protein
VLINEERIIARYEHQPAEVKRYRISYEDVLDTSELITSPVFVVAPTTAPPVLVQNVSIDPDGKELVMFLSGGVTGTVYRITVRTTTNAGQVLEDEIELSVREF